MSAYVGSSKNLKDLKEVTLSRGWVGGGLPTRWTSEDFVRSNLQSSHDQMCTTPGLKVRWFFEIVDGLLTTSCSKALFNVFEPFSLKGFSASLTDLSFYCTESLTVF